MAETPHPIPGYDALLDTMAKSGSFDDIAAALERRQKKYSYEIRPVPDSLGGGWLLQLFEDDEDVGGGWYPDEEYSVALDEALAWMESRE